MKNTTGILISSVLLTLSFICHGNGQIDTRWLEANYTKREAMVEMRDGIKLYTAIYEPATKKKTRPDGQDSIFLLPLRQWMGFRPHRYNGTIRTQ